MAGVMADLNLNEGPQFALRVAVGVSLILKPLLEFVAGVDPPSPVLQNAVAVILLVLPFTYLAGSLLVQLQMAAAPAPVPVPARRFACLACVMVSALLVFLAVPLTVFWLLTVTGSSPPALRGGL